MDTTPDPTDETLDARQAAELLGVKRATLYAYVSRGLLKALPTEGRASRYLRAEVERLRTRSAGRSGQTAAASGALRFREPAMDTAITAITPRGPVYRGQAALDLAAGGVAFEPTAELLWRGVAEADDELWRGAPPLLDLGIESLWLPNGATPTDAIRLTLSLVDGKRPPAGPRAEALERADARRIIRLLASAAGTARDPAAAQAALAAPSVAAALAVSFGVIPSDRVVGALDQALVLAADHELTVSTFTARIVASTGAELTACLVAAAAALSGPRHGGMCSRVEGLLEEATSLSAPADVLARRHARGEVVAGFGHPLYPDGDPRGPALLALARAVDDGADPATVAALAVAEGMARGGQPAPSLDFGLVALACALGLPRGAAQAIFAVARVAGWVAHVLEQRSQGDLLRPTARYIGG
ncbi:MAG: citrate synthase [Deltaproteobacteria bacterium HGW-Deltaproteobacteria-14]|nr:MAG: citrate synthase [Deltaproteobacteria bacterium HGW-Deltaproteobacteria-14]